MKVLVGVINYLSVGLLLLNGNNLKISKNSSCCKYSKKYIVAKSRDIVQKSNIYN